MKIRGTYFYGHKISSYGIEHKRVDYATLAKSFDAVLCNNIVEVVGVEGMEIESGSDYNYYCSLDGEYYTEEERTEKMQEIDDELKYNNNLSEEELEILEELYSALEDANIEYNEIYQYYIVSDNALYALKEAGEIVYYIPSLDVYVWGVTHWGTSWDYVLTDIEIEEEEEEEN